MQEINQFNIKLAKQRKSITTLVGVLLVGGFSLSIPLFNDSIKYQETLYCNKSSSCRGADIKRGVSFLVDRERRNQLFDQHIKIIKILPKEDDKAVYVGIFSSGLLLAAYGVSKALTNHQEKAVHSQFKLLKIKALENDLLEQTHLEIFGFTKNNQAEITKQAIARQTQETIQAMKSEGELQLDHLNGQLQGTLSIKSHQLQVSELDKETAKNELETAEIQRKLDKLSGNSKTEDTTKITPNEQLKQSLINALKSHENSWLWYLVESFTPIIIHGKAGSYKSYTAASIALLKHYLIDAKIESIADIDYDQNKNDAWKFLVPLQPNIYGQGIDWESYNDGYIAAIERSKHRTLKDKPIVSIWDELTNAKGKFDNAANIVPFVIATPRKRNEHCILISHNLTQDCLGGCSGISEPIKTQTYRLNLKTTPQAKPLFKGILEGLVDQDGNELEQHSVTLPDWLRPEKICQHFNGKPIDFDN
ncbi:hypothetical protein [Trichormus sp. NMC-1]|uniref:hypothetical protein n=1 Tax=Trichormus sp. NMC-1 TaxID=1853259 RepID=UPI0008DC166C|nr:hypothetical protein [Trichormus sp. NMC-1]